MERAGTGGSLFRNIYRDFLQESVEVLENEQLRIVHSEFVRIAAGWKEVSEIFQMVADTQLEKYIDDASLLLESLSEQERLSMEKMKLACD